MKRRLTPDTRGWFALLVSATLLGCTACESGDEGGAVDARLPPGALDTEIERDVDTSDGRGDGSRPSVRGFPEVERTTRGLEEPPDYLSRCKEPEVPREMREALLERDTCMGEGRRFFRDATLAAGAAHRHRFPEGAKDWQGYGRAVGGGAVLEDLNGDGWLDLYVTGGTGANRLLYNTGGGHFVDCTDYAGVAHRADWTNGVSSADFDGDGDQDLYLANAGPDRLLENRGDGTFVDVTEGSGLDDPGRSSSAGWADIDGDGRLDLVVASTLETHTMPGKAPPFDSDGRFDKEPEVASSIYLGRGDGTFREITSALPAPEVVDRSAYLIPLVDLNLDQRPDLLVLREFDPSHLLENAGRGDDGTPVFRDVTDRSQLEDIPEGNGFDAIQAPMGMAVLDPNGDGLPELSVSTLWGRYPSRETFLQNRGDFVVWDSGGERRAHAMDATRSAFTRAVSWGNTALDVENDGDEDLYIPYGALPERVVRPASPAGDGDQPNALVTNSKGSGLFEIRSGSCAEDRGASRGVARGDINGDGCVDLYVVNQEGPSRLLLNRCDYGRHYLEIRLVGTASHRDAVNATVVVETDGDTETRQVLSGSEGVHSSSPNRLHFGLGEAERADRVVVRWPSGRREVLRDVASGQLLTLREPRR